MCEVFHTNSYDRNMTRVQTAGFFIDYFNEIELEGNTRYEADCAVTSIDDNTWLVKFTNFYGPLPSPSFLVSLLTSMYVTGHYETAEVAEDVISFIVTNPRLTKSLVSLIKFHSEETTIIDLLAASQAIPDLSYVYIIFFIWWLYNSGMMYIGYGHSRRFVPSYEIFSCWRRISRDLPEWFFVANHKRNASLDDNDYHLHLVTALI